MTYKPSRSFIIIITISILIAIVLISHLTKPHLQYKMYQIKKVILNKKMSMQDYCESTYKKTGSCPEYYCSEETGFAAGGELLLTTWCLLEKKERIVNQ